MQRSRERRRTARSLAAWVALAGALCACTGALRSPAADGPPASAAVVHASPAVSPSPPPVAPGASPSTYAAPGFPPPRIGAPEAIVEDLDTGRVLFALAADRPRPIASLSKIMTAVLVLANTTPAEEVRISRLAAAQPETAVGLKAGTRVRVRDLMEALILFSANDAAVALAERVDGSVAAFVRAMNRAGASLGLAHTRFASPSGLNDRGYSTARDVATMTRWAYDVSPGFVALAATRHFTLRLPKHHRAEHLRNLDDMLWDYRGAVGAKTGFTFRAGWCLAAVAVRGRHRVLAVVLGDRLEPYADGARLLDYGFRVLRGR